ncbi:hypothetical protein Tco_0757791 [Tanacetum coccineum]
MAIYSASILEIAVLFCFFDDQLTNLSSKNCALPEDRQHLWRTLRIVENSTIYHTKHEDPASSHREPSSACTHGLDCLDLQSLLVD